MKRRFGGKLKLSRDEVAALLAQVELAKEAAASLKAWQQQHAAALHDGAGGIAFAAATLEALAHGLEVGGEHPDVRAGAISSLRVASASLAQVAADFHALADRAASAETSAT